MNKTLKDMLIGVILGDAHLGRTGLDKAFISFEQSKKKLEYLNYLHEQVKEQGLPLIGDTLTEYSREDTRYKVNNSSLYFRTQSLESLKPLADMFLDSSNKKIIPANIADHLSPRGLAFWIMDDGQQVKRGGVTLCTDSFNTNEVSLLREALLSKFNLETTIHHKTGSNGSSYERIYIKKDGLEEIKTSLVPYMHDSMLYKLNIVENTETAVDFKQDSSDIGSESNIDMDIDIFDV